MRRKSRPRRTRCTRSGVVSRVRGSSASDFPDMPQSAARTSRVRPAGTRRSGRPRPERRPDRSERCRETARYPAAGRSPRGRARRPDPPRRDGSTWRAGRRWAHGEAAVALLLLGGEEVNRQGAGGLPRRAGGSGHARQHLRADLHGHERGPVRTFRWVPYSFRSVATRRPICSLFEASVSRSRARSSSRPVTIPSVSTARRPLQRCAGCRPLTRRPDASIDIG